MRAPPKYKMVKLGVVWFVGQVLVAVFDIDGPNSKQNNGVLRVSFRL